MAVRLRSRPLTLLVAVTAAAAGVALIPRAAVANSGALVLRPGMNISANGWYCNAGFVWLGSDGNRYVDTSGTCAHDPSRSSPDELVYPRGAGPRVDLVRVVYPVTVASWPIGEFAYYSDHPGYVVDGLTTGTPAGDFGLIRLDPNVEVNPQACYFGGPTGINTDIIPIGGAPIALHLYGRNVGSSTVTPGRTVFALGMPERERVLANGPVFVYDGGAGATTDDGRAVGLPIAVGVRGNQHDPGTVVFDRYAVEIPRAEEMLHIRLALVTAPLLHPRAPMGDDPNC